MQRGHIVDHVERLRTKPEHIRMRMAVGASVGITAVVLLVWGSATLMSGKLALNPFGDTTNADGTTDQTPSVPTNPNNSLVAGAASAITGSNNPPALQIVGATSTPKTVQAGSQDDPTGGNQTVIQF